MSDGFIGDDVQTNLVDELLGYGMELRTMQFPGADGKSGNDLIGFLEDWPAKFHAALDDAVFNVRAHDPLEGFRGILVRRRGRRIFEGDHVEHQADLGVGCVEELVEIAQGVNMGSRECGVVMHGLKEDNYNPVCYIHLCISEELLPFWFELKSLTSDCWNSCKGSVVREWSHFDLRNDQGLEQQFSWLQ